MNNFEYNVATVALNFVTGVLVRPVTFDSFLWNLYTAVDMNHDNKVSAKEFGKTAYYLCVMTANQDCKSAYEVSANYL